MVRRVQMCILVGNHGRRVLRAKEEGDCWKVSLLLSAFSSKASISDGMGVHKCIWYGQLACFGRHYECLKVYIKVIEQHMLSSRWRLFQGSPCVFKQDNAKPHTAAITTAWLRSVRVRMLNWPACSPDLSPIENIWPIIKRKIHQRWSQTLQKLETNIRQEWDQIPTPKLQKLITSMPRHL